jgi:hypothetical protein
MTSADGSLGLLGCRAHRGPGHRMLPLAIEPGRYNLDTLIARLGQQFGIPICSAWCLLTAPSGQSVSAYDLCGVALPGADELLHACRLDPDLLSTTG